jgi:hypothetical protein
MYIKFIGLILLFIILGFAGIVLKGFVPVAIAETHILKEPNIENTPSAEISPISQEIALKFSGEVLTCTNKTDLEQVIDIRISNLDVEKKSIMVYPLNITIELLPDQIKRKDMFLPHGISALNLVSNDGEELSLQVPPCISRGGGGKASSGLQTTSLSDTTPIPKYPTSIPEYPTMAIPVVVIGLLLIFSIWKK